MNSWYNRRRKRSLQRLYNSATIHVCSVYNKLRGHPVRPTRYTSTSMQEPNFIGLYRWPWQLIALLDRRTSFELPKAPFTQSASRCVDATTFGLLASNVCTQHSITSLSVTLLSMTSLSTDAVWAGPLTSNTLLRQSIHAKVTSHLWSLTRSKIHIAESLPTTHS